MTTVIDLLRHGEPYGGKKYRGSLDDPLSQEGWRQMRAAIQGHPSWDSIVSSPLQRCAAFAGEVGEQLRVPVQFDERFREINFGQWEGFTAKEIMAKDRQQLTRFWQNPLDNPPPGGELISDFNQRVVAAWHQLVVQNRDQSVLLVVHGGVIRILLCEVLQTPLQHLSRFVVEYASLSRVRVDEVEGSFMPRLIFHAGRY